MTYTACPFVFNQFAGLTELPLPCDPNPAPGTSGRFPLSIRRASLKDAPSSLRRIRRQPAYDIGHGVLIEPDNISLYVSYAGDEIVVDCPDGLEAYAAGWVIHAGAALSTLFTGGLPLHGAGAVLDGKYFGLLAGAGTGKSTTLWALLGSGALFANDDLISVRFSEGMPTAYPSVSLFPKLHRTALQREGLNEAQYQAAPPNDDKFWVPIPAAARAVEPQKLSALFLLEPAQTEADDVLVVQNTAEDAAGTLRRNLHGLWLVQKYIPGGRIDALCRAFAASVPVYTLRYRKTLEILPRLVETIRSSLNAL